MKRDSGGLAVFIVTSCVHKRQTLINSFCLKFRQRLFDLPLNAFSFDDKQRLLQTHTLNVVYGRITIIN